MKPQNKRVIDLMIGAGEAYMRQNSKYRPNMLVTARIIHALKAAYDAGHGGTYVKAKSEKKGTGLAR